MIVARAGQPWRLLVRRSPDLGGDAEQFVLV
jgi:hypothetical protein